ncbi:MAG: response regulator transcription factor [Firmicutes bacterium]|jgi:DNA-binding response OmpR family regulator|nr:response regulator transcription factor [Bacillota bacterium]
MNALVIEDDERVARLLTLEIRHAGWTVAWRSTGREGLSEAVAGTYDLVILDLSLPDCDGLQVCQSLRQVSEVPVLVLTARDSVEDRVRGLDSGADDYLVKPFAASELLARMRALIRRPHTMVSQDSAIRRGPLELYPLRREVKIDGRAVELTRREFDLLHYFMQNPGITLTRDMILERVWGWGYAGGSNIVDVYVGYLRQKLDQPEANVPIATVRGVGYALRTDTDA